MYKINQSWLYGNVKPYFAKQGIILLKDDMLFIEKCLGNVPPEFHRKLIRDYFNVWNAKVSRKELNVLNPRYEANVYLRNVSGNPESIDIADRVDYPASNSE